MDSSTRAARAPRNRGRSARSGVRAGTVGLVAAALVVGGSLTSALAVPSAPADRAVAHVRGTVERMTLDDFAHPLPEGRDVLTFVRSGAGTLQVPASDLAHVATGSTVDLGLASTAGTRPGAQGGLVTSLAPSQARDPEAGADVASVDVVAQPAITTSSTGSGVAATDVSIAAGAAPHQVLVVVAQPAGGSAPTATPDQVAAAINGGVNTYWSTVTNGVVGFAATAYPTTVATTNVPCSSGSVSTSGAFWSEVQSKVGWTPGSGKHLVVFFSSLAACGGIAGLGSIGTGTGSGGVTWSNGFTSTGILGHELGHNLGLGHSEELDCAVGGVRVTDAPASSCSAHSYWDTNDIMALSWGNTGFLNASHLRRLGLLDQYSETAPTDNGQVTLAPLESGRGIRVLTLSDGATRYVVEFRQPIGLDSWMASVNGWGAPGVTVRREFDLTQAGTATFDARASYLLDGNPATADGQLGSVVTTFPVGSWVDLADGRLGLRITSQSDTGAVIEYRNGYATTDPRYVAPPRPVVSTPVATVVAGRMKPSATGPVLALRWGWTVTAPQTDVSVAAVVSGARAFAAARAGISRWVATGYRATAVAPDGTLVAATGRASTRYTAEGVSRAVVFSKGWSSLRTRAAMGSSLRVTSKRGGAVTVKASGRSVGVLLSRGARNGKVAVYVDGVRVATLNMRATYGSVNVAWSRTFPSSRTHVIRLVNLTGGTSGTLGFDGVVSLV